MSLKKSIYSIKDLETLSGIKAHTIRIWEKRYNILEPMRTVSNIRYYDLQNLQRLLNIALLHNHGYKISKISRYPKEKIPALVKEIVSEKNAKHHAINAFKIAMMNFDQAAFLATYQELLSEKSFGEIFEDVFIPFLNEVGLLWQTGTITPAHEHFISHLIRQKIMASTEKLQFGLPIHDDTTFILFLPENEIHETGLLYLNYELALNGYKSIYLGANVPYEDLKKIAAHFETIVYVSYLATVPDKEDLQSYIEAFNSELLQNKTDRLWLLGNIAHYTDTNPVPFKTELIHTLKDFVKKL